VCSKQHTLFYFTANKTIIFAHKDAKVAKFRKNKQKAFGTYFFFLSLRYYEKVQISKRNKGNYK